jgi:hypothetical protein
MSGLMVPLIEMGQNVKVTVVEREDFLGDEIVTTDDRGRPIMAVVTTRDDGEDRLVFAPLATGDADE